MDCIAAIEDGGGRGSQRESAETSGTISEKAPKTKRHPDGGYAGEDGG